MNDINKKIISGALTFLVSAFLLTTTAEAKHDHDDRDDDHHEKHEDRGGHDEHNDRRHYTIIREDRDVINHYYIQNRSSYRCPPGLRKKNRYCIPPGHYRRYVIGEYFPAEYVYAYPFPGDLVLAPAPYGTRYVYYDNDVYLIDDATRLILDAVFYPR